MHMELEIESFPSRRTGWEAGFEKEAEVKNVAGNQFGGKILLVLDGKAAGFLQGFEGGAPVAEVVKAQGPSGISKHLSNLRFEDIEIQVPLPIDDALAHWIAGSLAGTVMAKSGGVQWLDHSNRQQTILQFQNALLTEIGFPAMDASSKERGLLTLKLTPEYTRRKKGSGTVVTETTIKSAGKLWLASNFRLEIDGGPDASRVRRIEPIVLRRKVIVDEVGERRFPKVQAGPLEIPDLTVTLTLSSAESWYQWLDDFAIKGNSGSSKERSGKLRLLSPDLKTQIAHIELSQLGITTVSYPKKATGADSIASVNAGLYCGAMKLKFGP